jgi:glycosyltransferase involved in cell wall biosynthesis
MVKRVLMIAFHFPPLRGSSGIQRTLKFAQYLPRLGWQPLVLSAHPRAYPQVGDDQLKDIAPDLVVKRAFALDSQRHLSIKGRYPRLIAMPDKWISWFFGAVPAGLALVRRYRPQMIWSTYPIATTQFIGLALHKLTGLPWVADIRDPMWEEHYPTNPRIRALHAWIERKVVGNCVRVVCTTPSAVRDYRTRYPHVPPERFVLIENGFDEENFTDAQALAAGARADGPLTLVHSGVIYPSERDPVPMFQALADLKARGVVGPDRLRVILRATGHDQYIQGLIDKFGIGDVVTLAPHVAYREALSEMLTAGGLLIMQAASCNHQIPAKLYEYLRARRPILALTDPAGDTATTLRQAGIDTIAPLDSPVDIAVALERFLQAVAAGTAPIAADATIELNSRLARAEQLARVLDQITAAGAA